MASTDICTESQEISEIKEEFQEACKVLKDIGDYCYVVNIRPENISLAFKFQLTEKYPSEIPGIVLVSQKLYPQVIEDLRLHLSNTAASLIGTPMIKTLYDTALEWLSNHDIHVERETKHSPKSSVKKKKKKTKEEKPVENQKLASMKTADDVIKRIQWDPAIPTECCVVGYIDRFLGIMEKEFAAFTWEDIASQDYTVLAIPRHRIQYFKYKSEKVWDKNERMDNVFGSTGSGRTIIDVITRYEAEHFGIKPEQKDANDESDDDSDDDGIQINTGTTTAAANNEQVDWEDDNPNDPFWENKARPNHFVCVRITDPEICDSVACMQDAILDIEPRYAECIIPPAALHITLCTVGLDNPEQIANACRVLREGQIELADIGQKKIKIQLQGVDNFYHRVLYGKVTEDESKSFSDLANYVRVIFRQTGIDIRDNYEFVPHMTIMKTTRPVSRMMNTKLISSAIYQPFTEMKFGTQMIDSIHLCPMTADRDNGFYPCLQSIDVLTPPDLGEL